MAAQYSKTLEEIAKPFVESGIFASTDAFISNLVRDVAERKISQYETEISAFEAKYGPFDSFTRKIQGKATPKQEDQWMQWEGAVNMLKAWKQVVCELDSHAS